MECFGINSRSKNCVVNDRTVGSFIRKRVKCSSLETIYAGLIMCFVPSVLCNSDRWRQLTYEDIYNNTSYPQVQYTPRPYDLPVELSFNNHLLNGHSDESRENDIELLGQGGAGSSQLLVGFARAPFRYSVPEEDYMKGVRYVKPQPYSHSNGGENRGKRGVLHLYNMIYCATGCEPLTYKGYGCYCGFLGSGRPMDGIDSCCKMHDDCYENIFCPFFTVYFQPYYWKCYKGQPLCALENYHTQHQFINGCAARLCECDRKFAMCLQKYTCPRRRALCTSSPLRLLQNLLIF